MSQPLVTSLLLPNSDPQPLVAQVLGADATATTYLINCPSGTDGNDCGTYNETVTLGPWASKTLPPGAAATGGFDISVDLAGEGDNGGAWKFSIHCDMSRSVAKDCTTINIGGNNDGSATATFTAPDQLKSADLATFSYTPITITAGQELLSATHAATTAASSVQPASTASGVAAPTASGSGTSQSSTTAAPGKTSDASPGLARVFAAIFIAGTSLAMLLQ